MRKLDEYFKESIHEVEYCPCGSEEVFRHPDRKSYFGRIPAANLAASIILLDPDIGLEAKSTGAREGEKYVTYEEVASIFSRMEETSVLVIYQHLPHVLRKPFLYGAADKLMENLKCPMPVSISDNRIAFIIVAKTKKRQLEVRQVLQEYTRSHLEIYD